MPERLKLARLALSQHCEREFGIHRNATTKRKLGNTAMMLWHTIKAVTAVLLHRYESVYFLDIVVVAMFNHKTSLSNEFGIMHDWQEIVVPFGFRGWYYCIVSDGTP